MIKHLNHNLPEIICKLSIQLLDSKEIARDMAGWFDANIKRLAFRLSLEKDSKWFECLVYRGFEDGRPIMGF